METEQMDREIVNKTDQSLTTASSHLQPSIKHYCNCYLAMWLQQGGGDELMM